MNEIWEIANTFRQWVCSELSTLSVEERLSLRGDTVFIIDSEPRFIVLIDDSGAWSVSLFYNPTLTFQVDTNCPLPVNAEFIQNCISYSARTTVTTDSKTLKLILLGTLKAKLAFLTGRVKLSGDLAAFLKMVSILKRNGVRPLKANLNSELTSA